MPVLQEESSGGAVTLLTLNRPENYNALSSEMIKDLRRTLKSVAKNKRSKVIVIKGAGRGFCAGHDLRELSARTEKKFYESLVRDCSELMGAIQSLPQAVIAQVHGVATAAGCQLVASCDLAIAASDARFATPGVLIGLFCSTPMVALSRNVGAKKSMEMLLTGDLISAASAESIGLINRHVDAAQLEATVQELAARIADKSSYVIGLGKRAFYKQDELSRKEAYKLSSRLMVKNLRSPAAKEGIAAFLEKRKPVWPEG